MTNVQTKHISNMNNSFLYQITLKLLKKNNNNFTVDLPKNNNFEIHDDILEISM